MQHKYSSDPLNRVPERQKPVERGKSEQAQRETEALLDWFRKTEPVMRSFLLGVEVEIRCEPDQNWHFAPNPAWIFPHEYRVAECPTVNLTDVPLRDLLDAIGRKFSQVESRVEDGKR